MHILRARGATWRGRASSSFSTTAKTLRSLPAASLPERKGGKIFVITVQYHTEPFAPALPSKSPHSLHIHIRYAVFSLGSVTLTHWRVPVQTNMREKWKKKRSRRLRRKRRKMRARSSEYCLRTATGIVLTRCAE